MQAPASELRTPGAGDRGRGAGRGPVLRHRAHLADRFPRRHRRPDSAGLVYGVMGIGSTILALSIRCSPSGPPLARLAVSLLMLAAMIATLRWAVGLIGAMESWASASADGGDAVQPRRGASAGRSATVMSMLARRRSSASPEPALTGAVVDVLRGGHVAAHRSRRPGGARRSGQRAARPGPGRIGARRDGGASCRTGDRPRGASRRAPEAAEVRPPARRIPAGTPRPTLRAAHAARAQPAAGTSTTVSASPITTTASRTAPELTAASDQSVTAPLPGHVDHEPAARPQAQHRPGAGPGRKQGWRSRRTSTGPSSVRSWLCTSIRRGRGDPEVAVQLERRMGGPQVRQGGAAQQAAEHRVRAIPVAEPREERRPPGPGPGPS